MTTAVIFLLMAFPIWGIIGAIFIAIKLSERFGSLSWPKLFLFIFLVQVLCLSPLSISGVEGFALLSPWYLSGYFGFRYTHFHQALFLGACAFFAVVSAIFTVKAMRGVKRHA